VLAVGGGVAAGRDVTITASGTGIAAAVVHGNVTTGNPVTESVPSASLADGTPTSAASWS